MDICINTLKSLFNTVENGVASGWNLWAFADFIVEILIDIFNHFEAVNIIVLFIYFAVIEQSLVHSFWEDAFRSKPQGQFANLTLNNLFALLEWGFLQLPYIVLDIVFDYLFSIPSYIKHPYKVGLISAHLTLNLLQLSLICIYLYLMDLFIQDFIEFAEKNYFV